MAFKGALLKPSESRNGVQGSEEAEYAELKGVIRSGLQGSFDAGVALLKIRDKKLYKVEFATFDEFCNSEFKMARSRAYQLINAAKVKALLPANLSTIVDNEGQARALAAVAADQQEAVLAQVAEAGPVTAAAITEAAQSVAVAPPAPKKHLDKTGYPIPEAILPEWGRAAAFESTLREISKIKSIIEKATEDKDPIFGEVGNAAIAHLKNAYSDLTCVIPHAVCTSCQGRIPDKCTLCLRRGFISKFRYSLVPVETRRMREKKA